MIYIVCFFLSALFAYFDTRDEQKKHIGALGWIAILLPAVLAGLRDFSVGTDTVTYVKAFNKMAGQSFTQFLAVKAHMEIGFRFLFFAVSRITDDPHWALFAAHLFIMFFIYEGLRENGAGRYTWLGLTVFYLLFFSQSLNILRQYMGSALILWGFRYVKKEKIIGWLTVVIIASLFHKTSLFAIFIFYLYQIYVISPDRIYKNGTVHRIKPETKLAVSFCLLAGAALIFLFSRQLILLLHEITGKFTVQANNIRDYFVVDLYDVAYKVLFLVPFVLFRRSEANSNGDCDYYSMVIAVCMILSQLDMVSYNAGRVILPLWITLALAAPTLVSRLNSRMNRMAVSAYYLLICGWLYVSSFVIKGYSAVWPYTSEILGIG